MGTESNPAAASSRPWLAPAIGVGLAALVLAVFARPAHLESRRLESEADALMAKARGLDVLERTLAEARADAAAWRTRAARELREVPSEPGQAALMQVLRPGEDPLRNQTFTAAKPVDCGPAFPKDWAALPVTVTVDGAFPSIYELVVAAERLDRLVRVVRIEIDGTRPEGKEDRRDTVAARIELDAIFRDPALAAAAETAGKGKVR